MTAALAVLNPAALVALTDCEQRIERGLKTFIDVGQALAEIRDSRLYKGTHGTFEDYCRDRWKMSDGRARQFMIAAETATNVAVEGLPAPTNEGQARALAAVPEPERAEVWREAVERTNGKPTAAAVRAVQTERTQTSEGDAGSAEPERPAPPKWDPAERAAHEEAVQRRRDIDAAHRFASNIVTQFRSAVVTIVSGCRLGEPGLVTKDMIRDLHQALDLLEAEL